MKQGRPVTISGGRLVLPGEVREGSIRLVDGRIAALGDIAPQDGDEIVLRARARRDGCVPIGFGECRGTVLPAL